MPDGKVIGGILAVIFAILTGVFVWLADRESADTESKKYKGFYTGAMVSAFLFLASAIWAFSSWYMSTPESEAIEPEAPKSAVNVAGALGTEAEAIAGSAPDPKGIAQAALAGENTEALMSRAKELKQAGEAATARAEVARVTAEQAAATAGNQTAASHQKVTEAAVNAAAKKAAAEQAEETLQALSAAENAARKVEGQTRQMAAAQAAQAIQVKAKANANAKAGGQLLKAIPLWAAAGGGGKP